MTLMMMCALTPHLCALASDPAVREAVAALSEDHRQDCGELAQALRRCPAEAAAAVSLLGGSDLTPDTVSRCFDREALAFFHICGQCGAGELLAVLTRCTCAPTAEGLALLLGERRRMLAMVRYGLQLLWRMCGDDALPDALALFPEDGPARSAEDIVGGLIRQLKGGDSHG